MDDWSSFRTTTSEQQRLRAALSGFCESQDLPEEQRAAYTASVSYTHLTLPTIA